jgi:hypothetical protein
MQRHGSWPQRFQPYVADGRPNTRRPITRRYAATQSAGSTFEAEKGSWTLPFFVTLCLCAN